MFAEMIAQLRFAASVAFGVRFDIRSLERLVDALVETRREFGTIAPDGAEMLESARLDDATRRDLQLRRFRQQASRAARETAYYGALFDRLGVDPRKMSTDQIARIPTTGKVDFQTDPDAFVRSGMPPAYRCTTTGTTGRPASVAFSADEMRAYQLLAAMSLLLRGTISDADVVQISTSARATLGNLTFADACTRIGALVHSAGLVSPAHTLGMLAERRKLTGKKAGVSLLLTYPSHLGELVEAAPALGYGPGSFSVRRLIVGGELVTEGLKTRARRLFGDVPVDEGYGMTEIWPLGATRCPDNHLHFEPAQGLIEVIDPETGAPAEPGQIGTIVATPFAPYRQTTLLLRYDTEDLVRRLVGPPSCPLAHLPATGPLLGKRRLAVRHEHGWTTPRDVIEGLEAVEVVPLPARCGFWAIPGGVAVDVVTRSDTIETRRSTERSLEAHGVPLRELRLVHHRAALRRPLPWRCDLREAIFTPRTAGRGTPGPHGEPSRLDSAASPTELALPLPGRRPWR